MHISEVSPIKHLLLIVFFTTTIQTGAIADENTKVPSELSPIFEHLFSITDNNKPATPSIDQIEPIIRFVNSAKNVKNTYSMGKRKGATSNYYEFSLNRSLKEILNLVYNPDIPSHITTPASVRRSKWIQVNGKAQRLPILSDYLNKLTEPVLIKGVEFIENTPDTHSGAYYAYEMDRALLLTRHNGQMVLISISRQRDKSNVGKKGLVLGNDDNWEYLYTGQKGCTKAGLGWVDSYMYDSASIAVYSQTNSPTPRVRCGMFKWLRAGWAGINMVKPHHIRDGVERFAKPYKNIIESPALANTERLSKALRQISSLPEEELRLKIQRYYLNLKEIHQNQSNLARQWFDQLSGDNGHLAKMKSEEMRALLEKAYVKHLLGKHPGIDISFLIHDKTLATRYPK